MELVGRRASQHRLRRLAHENVTARTCRCLTPAEACTEAHCGPAGGNPRFGQCSPNDQRPIETCATPGPGTQRSRAGASPGSTLSRSVLARLTSRALLEPWATARARFGHMACYAKGPFPSGEGPELRKLVAGA